MTLQAVIFDFDGVIVDSERVKFERLRTILQGHNISLSKKDFCAMIGKKTGYFLKEQFGQKLSDQQILSISEERRKDQLKNIQLFSKPIKGITQIILFLKQKGLRLCVATGTKRFLVKETLRILGIQNVFDVLVTGEEVQSSKPDPEVYSIAIKKLKLKKENILVIEDSVAGVLAAKRAGLKSIAITTSYKHSQLKGAVKTFDSFAQIQTYLKKFLQKKKN